MTHGTRPFPAIVVGNRSRSLVVAFAALFVSAVSCSLPVQAQDTQPSGGSAGWRGVVVNVVTGEPVPRALVHSPDNQLAMFTDDQGRFEFRLPQAEASTSGSPAAGSNVHYQLALTARKPGFLENQSGTLFTAIGPSTDDITIGLTPEALIVGRVNLPASNQWDRIAVEVYKRQVEEGRAHWTSLATARVRSNGEFRLANLGAGEYKLFTGELLDRDPLTFNPRGQLYGYPPIYYPSAADFSSGAAIHLEAGKTFQAELAPVLQPYYPVKIAITGTQETEPVQASVALHGHRGPGYSLGYNGNSHAITGMLPNGTYTVEATLQGQENATGSVNITVKSAPVNNATIALLPHGSIPVNIRADVDAPSRHTASMGTQGKFSREQNADVSLQPAEDFTLRRAAWLRPPREPDDNALVLDNVGPGHYWVNIRPHWGYVASADAGGVDLLRHPLVVAPGGSSLAINVVLRDDFAKLDGSVEGPSPPASNAGTSTGGGRVTSYSGTAAPLPGLFVFCVPLPDSTGRFTETQAAPDGSFQVQQLPPGAYRILAFDRRQELEYENPEAMRAYEGKGPVIRLAPGQTEHVRVSLISSTE